ncbi:MAG: polysaccharide biosynthesis tyrosine autokinase [Anaerolineae bacterium]
MDLRDYIEIGRRWLWLFVLATAVAAAGAWVVSRGLPTQYSSRTTLMVGHATKSADPTYQDIYLSQSLAQTYAQMATREPVLQQVVEELDLNASWQALRGLVKAAPVPGVQLLEIRVIDTDPVRAQVIADTVAAKLIETSPTPNEKEQGERMAFAASQVEALEESITEAQGEIDEIEREIALQSSARAIADLQNRLTARQQQLQTWRTQYADLLVSVEGSASNSLEVIEPAAYGTPVGPNTRMNILFAAALGFGLALAAVLVLEYLDDTVKTSETVERRLGLQGLATVERVDDAEHRSDVLKTLSTPRSPIAEAFRVLRTNLEFALFEKPNGTVLVTSANPGDGKSTTASNLAVVMGQGDSRVILVDSDLRRPSVHRFFGLSNNVGLTTLLLKHGEVDLDDVMTPIDEVPGLSVITSGPLPPNPSELLKSHKMKEILAELQERADYVVMDSPPLLVVADGAILSTLSDATVIVFECGQTRYDAARSAIDVLDKVGVVPVGAVVNKLDRNRVGGYYYYYAYRYRYGEYYGSEGKGRSGGRGRGSSRRGDGSGGKRSREASEPRGLIDRLRQGVSSLLG